MISNTDYKVGDKVVYVGPADNGDDIAVGAEGEISYVDAADAYMTYKIQFPSKDWSVWVENKNLIVAPRVAAEDTEHCGWRDRALKAENELKELKQAIKTLSEV
jgi:hypothetical protein